MKSIPRNKRKPHLTGFTKKFNTQRNLHKKATKI
jgi:hypothetical protein